MTTGERIKEARKKAGLTQKELGEKLGISYQTLAQWENDLRNPKLETIQRIAAALDVPVPYLQGYLPEDWLEPETSIDYVTSRMKEIYGSYNNREVVYPSGAVTPYTVLGEGDDAIVIAGDTFEKIVEAVEASSDEVIKSTVELLREKETEAEFVKSCMDSHTAMDDARERAFAKIMNALAAPPADPEETQ